MNIGLLIAKAFLDIDKCKSSASHINKKTNDATDHLAEKPIPFNHYQHLAVFVCYLDVDHITHSIVTAVPDREIPKISLTDETRQDLHHGRNIGFLLQIPVVA